MRGTFRLRLGEAASIHARGRWVIPAITYIIIRFDESIGNPRCSENMSRKELLSSCPPWPHQTFKDNQSFVASSLDAQHG